MSDARSLLLLALFTACAFVYGWSTRRLVKLRQVAAREGAAASAGSNARRCDRICQADGSDDRARQRRPQGILRTQWSRYRLS